MKRFALIVGGVMLVGCAQKNEPAPVAPSDTNQPAAPSATIAPAPATPATPAPAATPVVTPAPATPAEPTAPVAPVAPTPAPVAAKPKPIFELTQDNKIYVFSSVEAMAAFSAGTAQPTVVEKPNFTPGGRTLVIEGADPAQADEIFASYNKLHPVAK